MATTLTKFNIFTENLAKGIHNLNSDTLKIALTNVAPVVTNQVFADITEIAAGNGYTAGGAPAAFVSGAQTSGVYKLVLSDVVFTASGGDMATFRYIVLYDFSTTSPLKALIGFADYYPGTGSTTITLHTGENFTTDFDQVNGVLTIT
jgi:hypothetical protein